MAKLSGKVHLGPKIDLRVIFVVFYYGSGLRAESATRTRLRVVRSHAWRWSSRVERDWRYFRVPISQRILPKHGMERTVCWRGRVNFDEERNGSRARRRLSNLEEQEDEDVL